MIIKKGTKIKLKCNLNDSYGERHYDKGAIVEISYVETDNRGNPIKYGVGGFAIPRHEFTLVSTNNLNARKSREKLMRTSRWVIYSYMATNGWFAYNTKTNEQKHLANGTFSEAVDVFDKEIGPYYKSRRYGR